MCSCLRAWGQEEHFNGWGEDDGDDDGGGGGG